MLSNPSQSAIETAIPGGRLIDEKECRHLTSLSRTQRWLLENDGKFPRRIRITERRHAWLESEVLAWIAQRVARRNSAAGH